MARRAIVRASRPNKDYVWLTLPLPSLLEAPNTQDENTIVTALDWRAADGFERATVLRLILQGCVMLEPGISSTCAAQPYLGVTVGNGQATVAPLQTFTTWNDFDLVAPWTTLLAQNAPGENVVAQQQFHIDISFRRRISVEDNVTLVTANVPLTGVAGTDIYWGLMARVLLQRE